MVEHRTPIKFEYKITMPPLEDLDPTQVVFDYDADCDTLFVHFYGGPKPAVSVLTPKGGNYGYARVDPETEQVVGIEVECFVSEFVQEDPVLLAIAEMAGVPEELIKQARREIPEEKWKEALIGALFGSEESSPRGVPI